MIPWCGAGIRNLFSLRPPFFLLYIIKNESISNDVFVCFLKTEMYLGALNKGHVLWCRDSQPVQAAAVEPIDGDDPHHGQG